MAGESANPNDLSASSQPRPTSLELGLIGNCQIGALVDADGRIVWCCLPRFDGDPFFSQLMDTADHGYFAIELKDQVESRQYYQRNTAILCTELTDKFGSRIRITDFCPRFRLYDRTFRPEAVIRRVQCLAGTPVIRVRLRPTTAYGEPITNITHGSHHIRYIGQGRVTRLTTDASITHVLQESPIVLEGELNFALGPDESITESVTALCQRFETQTTTYWQEWARGLAIPFEWQNAVIRAATTLKLSTFEDTGAVIAAMTTSVPEAANTQRNWDYRYCWLRDAYFVVHALNRLGATATMENYLNYIINLVVGAAEHELQPLYGIGGEVRIEEYEVSGLAGYRGMGPVRVGNAAYHQVQHDVYGAVVLAANQAFFDERLARPGDEALFRRLTILGEQAARLFDKPDAGIWEYRGRARVHTYSAIMCWAACDRLARIAAHLGLDEDATRWRQQADRMHDVICREAWSEPRQAFTESFGGDTMDASLLLMHELDFLAADDPRFVSTVGAIEAELRRGDHLFRYAAADDFGHPENAFNICTFWYIDALWAIGRRDEARRLFENMLECRNAQGLLSEDLDTTSHELWGNFPQTYSMVGLINSALHLSRSWEEAV
ncbi:MULTISPECIES: glycoside hydrolase family 15 protein [unclassified Modicisalibacter]|uniref:glycoside hydrolase family 15 protein n=1 Tax=unclassified Modicisalibacter TaxID=2679913 RepID=UPI001CCDAF1F|nr:MULTISPECIES: glycoside hydrolase family 15 protein [unclassified Modicisalibacter]MBZ9558367.1 glycoside hydrolase family 15 protein [Modicisalibacter sp. R2A 31.J]MBZ9575741.1 glycoside hydrolase family 15 protein [Modicisalibacter sp. MOD 31.J]